MTAVCPESLTAITSPSTKHLNTAAAAFAESSQEEADTGRQKWLQGAGEADFS